MDTIYKLAFPFNERDEDGAHLVSHEGMYLWDYFAAHAPDESIVTFHTAEAAARFLGESVPDTDDEVTWVAWALRLRAKQAAFYADSLLAERAKRMI